MTAAAAFDLEFDIGPGVILVATKERAPELAGLAQALLAAGFDVRVAQPPALGSLLREQATPAVIAVCRRGAELSVDTLRRGASGEVEHAWIDAELDDTPPIALTGPITAALGSLLRQPEQIERVDVDEVSNVVLLPQAPPAPTRSQWWKAALSGAAAAVIGVTVMVVAMAMPPGDLPPAPPVELEGTPVPVARPEAPAVLPPALPRPPTRTDEDSNPTEGPPETETETAEIDDALVHAIADGKVSHHGELLVTEPMAGERTWAQAMNACGGRRIFGVRGWRVPTRPQLAALARARALPDAPLWSRNRADRESVSAFIVGGRSGVARARAKDEALFAVVCVRRDAP